MWFTTVLTVSYISTKYVYILIVRHILIIFVGFVSYQSHNLSDISVLCNYVHLQKLEVPHNKIKGNVSVFLLCSFVHFLHNYIMRCN